ncbi:uncharacterized protein LOC121872826 [Homarus americanus]|uniref:uncharacterized protein LOC121872826 n=1 Tax=Homarus americanus TaxID=6706 RepID=UPI001C45BD68|nr:uncharacterized protein LOC121872826 [Homarus americanus]
MAWNIIVLLLLCCGTVVLTDMSTSVLKPGALVAPLGRVLVVEEVVNIKYELHGLLQLPRQMENVDAQLQSALDILQSLSSATNVSTMVSQTIELLHFRLMNLRKLLVAFGKSIPASEVDLAKEVRSQTRRKRGLFNFVGLIQSTLLGTATAYDVAKFGNRMNIVDQAVSQQNRVISQTFHAISALESKVNAIISESNHVSRVVNKLQKSIPTLEWLLYFTEYLHAAEI